ncbi:MAG TPA: hypothetical protein PKY25_00485 [Bacilli bacterium]|nr:hypothetical protein [Bacilli bacterium]
MKKVLILGFKGDNNSSKVLLDSIKENKCIDKLYLDNDFRISETQLIEKINLNSYNTIYAFGQKPLIKSIYIEENARDIRDIIKTDYNYEKILNYFKKYYKVKLSDKAGNYLCNNIYYKGLQYITDNNLKIKIILIHIPYINNINIIEFSKVFNKYLKKQMLL